MQIFSRCSKIKLGGMREIVIENWVREISPTMSTRELFLRVERWRGVGFWEVRILVERKDQLNYRYEEWSIHSQDLLDLCSEYSKRDTFTIHSSASSSPILTILFGSSQFQVRYLLHTAPPLVY
jgi:hypothetical protein